MLKNIYNIKNTLSIMSRELFKKEININETRGTTQITIPKKAIVDGNVETGDILYVYDETTHKELNRVYDNTIATESNTTNRDNTNGDEYKQQVKDLTLQLETQSMKLIELERLRTKEADYNKLLDLLVKYVDTELSQLIQSVIAEVTTQHKTTIAEVGLFQRLLNNINLTVDTDIVDELEKETKTKLLETIRELKE